MATTTTMMAARSQAGSKRTAVRKADQRPGEPDGGGKAGQRDHAEDAQQPDRHGPSCQRRRLTAFPPAGSSGRRGGSWRGLRALRCRRSARPRPFPRRRPATVAELRRDDLLDRLGARHREIVVRFEGARLAGLHIVGVADDPDRPGLGLQSARRCAPRSGSNSALTSALPGCEQQQIVDLDDDESPLVSTVSPPASISLPARRGRGGSAWC